MEASAIEPGRGTLSTCTDAYASVRTCMVKRCCSVGGVVRVVCLLSGYCSVVPRRATGRGEGGTEDSITSAETGAVDFGAMTSYSNIGPNSRRTMLMMPGRAWPGRCVNHQRVVWCWNGRNTPEHVPDGMGVSPSRSEIFTFLPSFASISATRSGCDSSIMLIAQLGLYATSVNTYSSNPSSAFCFAMKPAWKLL